jgi:amidohydrolase
MFLTGDDLAQLASWRRKLHRAPELSGEEAGTAREVCRFLKPTTPDWLLTGLGGHGVAAVYDGAKPGRTILFRAELDALPIEETSSFAHRSGTPGKAHLCGYDGHMATLAALARGLAAERPKRGRAVLLFQPAEEDGSGAAAVIADPKFKEIAPDMAFAWHNMPGRALGRAALKAGPVNCASLGMRIALLGKTSHASTPQLGVSPMAAVASLMPALTSLGTPGPLDDGFAMVTVTHAGMGAKSFGVAPGSAEIWVTLRTLTDARMESLRSAAEALAHRTAADNNLQISIRHADAFAHCENDPKAVDPLARSLEAEGVIFDDSHLPMLASEDFGQFGRIAPSAMFLLGAGEACPGLHNHDYDFPDQLIAIGARVLMRTLRDILG